METVPTLASKEECHPDGMWRDTVSCWPCDSAANGTDSASVRDALEDNFFLFGIDAEGGFDVNTEAVDLEPEKGSFVGL